MIGKLFLLITLATANAVLAAVKALAWGLAFYAAYSLVGMFTVLPAIPVWMFLAFGLGVSLWR